MTDIYYGEPRHMALAPDGSRVAMATEAGLYILDIIAEENGTGFAEPRRVARGFYPFVAWTPDSATLVANIGEDRAQFFDADTGEQSPDEWRTPAGLLRGISISPDGQTMAARTNQGLYTVNLNTLDSTLLLDMDVRLMAFLPDGRLVAYTQTDGTNRQLHLLDVTTGAELQRVELDIFATDISVNAAQIMLAGMDLRFYNADTLALENIYIASGQVAEVLPNNEVISARPFSFDPAQHVIDYILSNGAYVQTLDGQLGPVQALDALPLPDGSIRVVSHGNFGDVVLWNLTAEGWTLQDRSTGWHRRVRGLAWAPDAEALAVGTGLLSVLDLSDPTAISETLYRDTTANREFDTGLTAFLNYLVYINNDNILTTGSTLRGGEGHIQIWLLPDNTDAVRQPQLESMCNIAVASNIDVNSAMGRIACVVPTTSPNLWELRPGNLSTGLAETVQLLGRRDVQMLAMDAAAAERVALSFRFGGVKVVDFMTGEELYMLEDVLASNVILHGDRLYISEVSEGDPPLNPIIRVVDLVTGTDQRATFDGDNATLHGEMALSPDGALLALYVTNLLPTDDQILLLDATTLDILHAADIGQVPVDGLDFSPDGTRLVARTTNAQLLLWDVVRQGIGVALVSNGALMGAFPVLY